MAVCYVTDKPLYNSRTSKNVLHAPGVHVTCAGNVLVNYNSQSQ